MSVGNGSSDPRDFKQERASAAAGPIDSWRIDATPIGLLDTPLDFIFAEHHRQRQAAQILSLVAHGEFDRRGVEGLVKFFEVDFARHVADEELAFFPLLRAKCQSEDNIDALISRLADEHQKDEAEGEEVIAMLKQLLGGEALTGRDRGRLRCFAEHVHQHIALENAVLLPIARVRLDDAALMTLADILKERHARRAKA